MYPSSQTHSSADPTHVPTYFTHTASERGVLHRAGRYDRLADDVERVTGRRAMSVPEFVSLHADQFGGRRSQALFRVVRIADHEARSAADHRA
jgi:hypothetical protein